MISNLVRTTWLVQYKWPVELTYDQWGYFLGHKLKNNVIEREYVIKTNPDSSGNPQENANMEIINQVLGNLVQTCKLHETYVGDTDPWMVILAAAAFAVRSTYHRNKGKSRVQLVLDRYMIPPINHIAE